MTKLSISLAIATLTVSLAPAAQAYGVAPEAEAVQTSPVEQINVLFGAYQPKQADICELHVTPVLANALGLTTPQQSTQDTIALVACVAE